MFNPLLRSRPRSRTLPAPRSQPIHLAVPIVGAIHVLAIAWFGGAALVSNPQLAAFRWTGLTILLSPVHCCSGRSLCACTTASSSD